MIWTRHVHHRLAPFVDGALPPAERRRIETHLSACPSCRTALESHHAVASLLQDLTPVQAPATLWHAITTTLDQPHRHPRIARPFFTRPVWQVAVMAVIVVAVTSAWWISRRPQAWDVVHLNQPIATRMADGEWLETTESSTAALRIGEIGRVDLAPGTRLQLLSAQPHEHRLNLRRGRISVEIIAPPRVFFVETPTSTVVDLGCAYTMDVDASGGGILRVTSGWAALEWGDRQSLVPAGASASTRPSLGPGTPSFDDATEAFKRALDAFDFSADKAGALAIVLTEARTRDTLTLWHLLSRVDASERLRVFDHLVALTPLPSGVDRARALALDVDTLRRWREELAWTW